MRYVVITGLAVFAGILIRIKKEYKNRILIGFSLVMILMSALYNMRLMGKVMPSFHPTNQMFYQTSFIDKGDYPDSLLLQLFKGRTVYVKDDTFLIDEAEGHGKNYLYAYYHAKNMYWFLDMAGAETIRSEDMNDTMINEAQMKDDFVSLGNTNDMFRYCFMYNDIPDEPGNYFTYYWYYYDYLDTIKAYINQTADPSGETVFDADELVILWDAEDGTEEEDIYIMTKAYYDEAVSGKKEVSYNE